MAGMIKDLFGKNVQELTQQRQLLNQQQTASFLKNYGGDTKQERQAAAIGVPLGRLAGRKIKSWFSGDDSKIKQAKEREADAKDLAENYVPDSVPYFNRVYEIAIKNNQPEIAIAAKRASNQTSKEQQDNMLSEANEYAGELDKQEGQNILTQALQKTGLSTEASLSEVGQLSTTSGLAALETFNNKIISLGSDLETSGLNEAAALQTQIESIFEPFKKQLEDPSGGVPDIPGVGRFSSILPAELSSKIQIKNRNFIENYRNTLLKTRSGGAVTPEEAQRLYDELGKDEYAIYRAVTTIGNAVKERQNFIFSSYSPQVQKTYRQRLQELNAEQI